MCKNFSSSKSTESQQPLQGICRRLTIPRPAPRCPMRHMVVIVPELTGYASIRHVAVSLPYVAQLIDGVKYMLPGT